MILEVENLRTQFYTKEGVIRAVDGVSLSLKAGAILGLAGESGSGKSVTALSITRLVPTPQGRIVGGRILFEGQDLLELSDRRMRDVRGQKIAMVTQDPMSSLNPQLTIGWQLREALRAHKKNITRDSARRRSIDLFNLVGLPEAEAQLKRYPHELSGGMRQRVMIAMALSCEPKLLIADEPTTALDVTIQAQIIELIKRLSREFGMAVLLITHDLGVVASAADSVVIMYAGRVVEAGSVEQIFFSPAHPYTVGLMRSIPQVNQTDGTDLVPIEGRPPDLYSRPDGCSFHPRCWLYNKLGEPSQCATEDPLLYNAKGEQLSACHYWELVHGNGTE